LNQTINKKKYLRQYLDNFSIKEHTHTHTHRILHGKTLPKKFENFLGARWNEKNLTKDFAQRTCLCFSDDFCRNRCRRRRAFRISHNPAKCLFVLSLGYADTDTFEKTWCSDRALFHWRKYFIRRTREKSTEIVPRRESSCIHISFSRLNGFWNLKKIKKLFEKCER